MPNRSLRIAMALLMCVALGQAGLHNIKPRPQQMGLLSVAPLVIDGALVLTIPDNPLPSEAVVRDECLAQLTALMGIPPIVVPYSEWQQGQVSLWVGTPTRFPDLMDSLAASQIPGLGQIGNEEEYQVLVDDSIIYLAGSDQLGLQWGLMSLMKLIAPVNGVFTIDRAYIRDWPDFAKRVCTINSSVRIQSQLDYVDSLANMAYNYKMDEIEWNDPDGGHPIRSDFAMASARAIRSKIDRRGQFLTFGVDRTALRVLDLSWQEGVPIRNEAMTVGATYLTTNSYGINVANGGFESWSANVPSSWTMYPASSYATISRDNTQRHSGSSSLRWANLDPGYDLDRTVHQRLYLGRHRLFNLKLWVKTQNFSGKLRLLVLGDEPVNNHFENRRISLTPTANWTQIEMDFSIFNEDTVSLWIGPDVYSSGTLWIDDIVVEPWGLRNMLRRDDTPLEVYKQPGNILMREGVDYSVADLNSPPTDDYIVLPRISRIAGGQLTQGNSVTVNYYTAIIFQDGRETVCFSKLEPLEYYQRQIAVLDSALAPDGFKIHINEVTLAGYDPLCLSRGLSPGQLCGWHCNELAEIINARRPDAPIRIYGDAFDIWVDDNRCHPVETSPWTVGALQQLMPEIEIMAMSDYSTNLDSSFAYFNANGHSAVMAYYGSENFSEAVNGAISARKAPNCTGFQFYDWDISVTNKLLDFSCLGWNFGPFFIHSPVEYSARPDTVSLVFEAWADSFRINQVPSLTARSVSYRFLPGGNWATVTPTSLGSNRYRLQVVPPANATSIEYYFRATDHRNQVRLHPPDAPLRVFSAAFPPAGGNDQFEDREYSGGILPRVSGSMIEWDHVKDASSYEIHWCRDAGYNQKRQSLVSVVPGIQTEFFLDPQLYDQLDPKYLIVYARFKK